MMSVAQSKQIQRLPSFGAAIGRNSVLATPENSVRNGK